MSNKFTTAQQQAAVSFLFCLSLYHGFYFLLHFSEYYFSSENLERDFFFRRKMDAEGFIPISLIASFPRLQAMTTDGNLVIDAIRSSDKLEISPQFKVSEGWEWDGDFISVVS